MSSVGRWVLTHAELEATVHRLYLSASWADSPFETVTLDEGC